MLKIYDKVCKGDLLVDEILAVFPDLRGELTPDGEYRDPLVSVQTSQTNTKVRFPDDLEPDIDLIVGDHDPLQESIGEAYDQELQAAKARLSTLLKGPSRALRVEDLRDLILILNLDL